MKICLNIIENEVKIYGEITGKKVGETLYLSWNNLKPNELGYLNFNEYYHVKQNLENLYEIPFFNTKLNTSDFIFIDKKYCITYEEKFDNKLNKELE